MTDPGELLARYLAQRDSVDEGPLFLDPDVILKAEGRGRPEGAQQALRPQVRPSSGSESVAARDAAVDSRAGGSARRPIRKSAGRPSRETWREGAPAIPSAGIIVAPPASDLFAGDELAQYDLDGLAAQIHSCSRCPLHASRTNAVPGEGPGDARLVVVGEGPGAREDETGRPFVGRAGELLTDILRAIDLPRERVYICNVVKCRPPENRAPVQEEIDQCVPYLYRQLEIISPAVILAMGGTAAQTLLNTRQSLGSLRNRLHSFRGVPLLVTYHPAALLRNPNWKKPTWDDVRIARQLVDR
ncbi:MAG: uracil-DNA glycosylase [Gemmatimonadota bacterium]|nr:MAG: uracil-DNA glycosylase [Gemmatimonadota bacterium]